MKKFFNLYLRLFRLAEMKTAKDKKCQIFLDRLEHISGLDILGLNQKCITRASGYLDLKWLNLKRLIGCYKSFDKF